MIIEIYFCSPYNLRPPQTQESFGSVMNRDTQKYSAKLSIENGHLERVGRSSRYYTKQKFSIPSFVYIQH